MKASMRIFKSVAVLAAALVSVPGVPEDKGTLTGVKVPQAYGKLPLAFEVNRGQTDRRVKFLSRGNGYTLFLTGNEAVLALRSARQKSGSADLAFRSAAFHFDPRTAPMKYIGALQVRDRTPSPESQTVAALRMRLVGANPAAKVTGLDELSGKSNYFIGNDPKKWRTNVPNYARVRYQNVYAGVDVVYYGNQRQLEHDFVVAPGADPRVIRFALVGEGSALPRAAGGRPYQIDRNGDLVIGTAGGEVRLQKPMIYQEAAGGRREIAGGYRLKDKNQVSFEVGAYDASKSLVIDPALVLVYSTYLGGNGDLFGGFGTASFIAVDSSGNAYVTGSTTSTNFPTVNPFQATLSGSGFNAYVTKFNAAGNALVYSTYLGGTGGTGASAIAVDSSGNAYVTGFTDSTNFPTANPFQAAQAPLNCNCARTDAFVTKLNAAGNALVYSTYLGGGGSEEGLGIAVDSSGSAYVTGVTGTLVVPGNFPTTANAFQPASTPGTSAFAGLFGSNNAFVTKLNATGNALVYSTYLGGSQDRVNAGGAGEVAWAIAVDSSGNAYVTGQTPSTNFPIANAFQPTFLAGSPQDGFVTKFNATGTALLYSTFLGGIRGTGVAVDSSGTAYVAGELGGAHVIKLSPTGSVVYSSLLALNGLIGLSKGIAVDSSGNAYVSATGDGSNTGSAFPFGGLIDAVVAKLNAAGTALDFFTYLGGSGFEDSGRQGIALDSCGSIYVTGVTTSTNFPTVNPFQATLTGGCSAFGAQCDVFVSKIAVIAGQVQPPINADGSSVFNASRGVVPVKFTLTVGACSTSCNLPPATIALSRTSGGTPGPINQSDFILQSDTGSNFRVNNCQYVYNLDTGSLGAGSYLVQIKINGSVAGSATFALQ